MADMIKMRQRLLQRHQALKTDRAGYFAHWQQIARNILPHAGRFFSQDKKGSQRFGSIYDNTGTYSHGVLTAGFYAGLSSPARPWFKMAPADTDLAEVHDVAVWLEEVVERMHSVLGKSNFYRVAQHVYGEVAAFGTAVAVMLEDSESIVHFVPLTAGEYCLQMDWRDRPCAMFRELWMPAGAIAKEFGIEAMSTGSQHIAKTQPDTMLCVVHGIYERAAESGYRDQKGKRWESVYFEQSGQTDQVLRVSGFDDLPVVAPRWKSLPGETYGVACPGMVALGDIRGLQHKHETKARGLNQMLDPALVVDVAMKNREVDALPGGITFATFQNGKPTVAPLHANQLPVGEMREDIREDHERIKRAFYVDLFLLLASRDDTKTAYEVAQLVDEKMTVIGPVIQSLDTEFLRPVVEFTFRRMLEVGALPPMPDDLSGQQVEFEFVGALAQAQKAIGLTAIDRAMGNLAAVAQMRPEALDNIDPDEWVREYFGRAGAPAKLLIDPGKRDQLREARNRAMAAKETAALMQQQAGVVKDLAGAQTEQPSALSSLMGYA